MQKIFDKNVDCYCNKNNKTCNGNCRCYCHVPIWYRNCVWKIQGINVIGNILIVLFMVLFQPFISIYLIFFGRYNEKNL